MAPAGKLRRASRSPDPDLFRMSPTDREGDEALAAGILDVLHDLLKPPAAFALHTGQFVQHVKVEVGSSRSMSVEGRAVKGTPDSPDLEPIS